MKKNKSTKNKYGLGSWMKGTYNKFEDSKVGGVATDLAKANMSMGVSALGIDPGFEYQNKGIGKVAGAAGKVNKVAAGAAAGVLLPGIGGEAIGAAQDTGSGISNKLNQEQPPSMMNPASLPKDPYNVFADGGFTEINNGGTHESNPYDGVPIGEDDLVEEGEVISKLSKGDYVFSNRLNFDKKRTFADQAKKIKSKYTRVNDKLEQKDLQEELEALSEIQEPMRITKENSAKARFMKKYGGKMIHSKGGGLGNPPTTRAEALATNRLPEGADVNEYEQQTFDDVTSYSKKGTSDWNPSSSDTRQEYNAAFAAAKAAGQPTFPWRGQTHAVKMAGEDEVYHTQTSIDPLTPMGVELSNPALTDLGLKESGAGTGVTPWNEGEGNTTPEGADTSLIPNRGWKQGLVGAVPAAVGGIYNIASALMEGKEDVNYDRVRPEEISLARERGTARRRGSNTGASLTSAITKGGRPSSAAMIAGRTAVDRGTGEQVGRSYQNEETYNAGARERASFTNAGIQMKETEAQAMEDAAYQQRIDSGVGSIANAATSYGQSVQKGGAWADYLNASRTPDGYGAKWDAKNKAVTVGKKKYGGYRNKKKK